MKRITITKDPLKDALKWVKQVVDRHPTLDVLANVLVVVAGETFTLTATDTVVTLSISIKCAVEDTAKAKQYHREQKFIFLLPIDFLYDLLQTAMSDVLSIETDGTTAKIRDFFDETDIGQLDDVNKFPPLPKFPEQNSIEINERLVSWLVKAKDTTSPDISKPFSKVLLNITSEGVFLASTNAKVIFEKRFDVQAPGRDVQLLLNPKIIRALKGLNHTVVFWNKTHVAFKTEHIEVIGTLQNEKFPDYRRFLQGGEINLTVGKYDLLAALDKVMVATRKGNRRTVIWLKKEIGSVLLVTDDIDYNRKITARLGTDYTGDVVWITIDPEELYRLINQAEDDTLPMSITDPKKGIIVKSESDPSYTGFIMPIA